MVIQVENIFNEIKEMEAHYENQVQDAVDEARKVVEDAKKQALELTTKLKNEVMEKKEKQIDDAKASIKIRKEKLIRDSQKTFDEIRSQADSNKAKALKFVLDKFEEEVLE